MRDRNKPVVLLLVLLVSASCGTSLLAQQGPPRGGPPHGMRGEGEGREGRQRPPFPGGFPPDSGFGVLSSEMRFGEKVVKEAPFSARAITESVQSLSDGTKLTRKMTAVIYRDSEGRTRREQDLGVIGPFPSSNETLPVVFISDPVAGAQYVLYVNNKTARKLKVAADAPPMERPHPQGWETRTEALGKQVLEGLEAEGTRSTTTIPAGQIGNDRPIEILSERWYSPALQAVLMTRHSDPRLGTTTYRLTDIKREEPARALFAVPSEYRVDDRPGPPRGRRRMGD